MRDFLWGNREYLLGFFNGAALTLAVITADAINYFPEEQ